jgi:hypothetical protein
VSEIRGYSDDFINAETYGAGAAAVACVLFDVSVVALGADLRWGERAKVEGQEENCCTCTGLVLERERIAPVEGRKGIILVAVMKDDCRPQRGVGEEMYDEYVGYDSHFRMACRAGKMCAKASPIIGGVLGDYPATVPRNT